MKKEIHLSVPLSDRDAIAHSSCTPPLSTRTSPYLSLISILHKFHGLCGLITSKSGTWWLSITAPIIRNNKRKGPGLFSQGLPGGRGGCAAQGLSSSCMHLTRLPSRECYLFPHSSVTPSIARPIRFPDRLQPCRPRSWRSLPSSLAA